MYIEIYKDIIETNDPIIHQSQSLSSCERINEYGVLKEMARILHFDEEQEYSTSIQGGDVTDIRQISLWKN